MKNLFRQWTRHETLAVGFASLSLVLLGTVAYQSSSTSFDAMMVRVPVRNARAASASSASLSRLQLLQIARSRMRAEEKIKEDAAQKKLIPHMTARYLRTATGVNVVRSTSLSASSRSVSYERSKCGDGLVISPEECDDKNTWSGDGCSSTCTIEAGFQCTTGQPTYCWDSCGDGKVSSREKCDDGNDIPDDGCSPQCTIDPGYTCDGSPSVCVHP